MDDLQRRLDAVTERWGLRLADRMSGGFSADVFVCHDERGDDRVLKLVPTVRDAKRQAVALRAWSGKGAVRLIDVAEDLAALLMVRLRPGTPLPSGHDEVATAIVAGVLRALHNVAMPDDSLPSMAVAFDEYIEHTIAHSEPGSAGLALLDASRSAAMMLCDSTTDAVLLHGDPLDKNLLLDGGRYVAIDPIPRIGDPCSDIGFFAAGREPCSGIVERACRLAQALRVDAERASRWAAVWAVGEACETWRADSDELQEWVRSRRFAELLAV
jgi:streptomycin 6-kinase